MIKGIKNSIRSVLPIRDPLSQAKGNHTRSFVSYSVMRSGQHLILDWLSRGLKNTFHLNHCWIERNGFCYTFMNWDHLTFKSGSLIEHSKGLSGQKSIERSLQENSYNCIYSFENQTGEDLIHKRFLSKIKGTKIYIIRDPYNCIASNLKLHYKQGTDPKREIKNRAKILSTLLGAASQTEDHRIVINYNKFVQSKDYRCKLASDLGLNESHGSEALDYVPDFAGGSSFSGLDQAPSLKQNVLERWREFESDSLYRDALSEGHLRQLAREFFWDCPEVLKIEQALFRSIR